MQVGFIGLGKMGQPMCRRLLAAGHTVHVFNRSQPAIDRLVAEGAQAAASSAEIAERSEVVLTALPTMESVAQVYGDLATAARSGQLFLDHSTVSPSLNRSCANWLAARGASF